MDSKRAQEVIRNLSFLLANIKEAPGSFVVRNGALERLSALSRLMIRPKTRISDALSDDMRFIVMLLSGNLRDSSAALPLSSDSMMTPTHTRRDGIDDSLNLDDSARSSQGTTQLDSHHHQQDDTATAAADGGSCTSQAMTDFPPRGTTSRSTSATTTTIESFTTLPPRISPQDEAFLWASLVQVARKFDAYLTNIETNAMLSAILALEPPIESLAKDTRFEKPRAQFSVRYDLAGIEHLCKPLKRSARCLILWHSRRGGML